MAKIDPKVMESINKLEIALASPDLKANKKSWEATKKMLDELKRRHGIKT